MSEKLYQVLFVCTHNSARSIMAEGLLNSMGLGHFVAYSAGSHPSGQVNPFALKTLVRMGLPTDGYRSKDWAEFARAEAPQLDFVFTVCDQAAGEVCPVWPAQPMTAHWGVPDPAAVEGSDEDKRRAFLTAYSTLSNRINLLLSLSIDKLDRLAIKQKLDDIARG